MPVAGLAARAGDVVVLGAGASVQFAGDRAIVLRVISVDPRPTYRGWVWLRGYELDRHGNAVEQRDVFVQIAGVRRTRPHTRH